jgi:hypothetical protein
MAIVKVDARKAGRSARRIREVYVCDQRMHNSVG